MILNIYIRNIYEEFVMYLRLIYKKTLPSYA